jgi:cell wall-associated NlpC family hydrolase
MLKWLAAAGAVVAGFVTVAFVAMASLTGATAGQAAGRGGCGVTLTAGHGGGAGKGVRQRGGRLSASQLAVAKTIVGIGKGMHVTQRGTVIALAVARQESNFDPNAVSPSGRSVGIYQQQGALYADVDRRDPASAAAAFYEQLLKGVPNYNDPSVPIAQAGQEVQRSGAGAKYYAQWVSWATALGAKLYTGTTPKPAPNGGGGNVAVNASADLSCSPGGGSGPVHVAVHGRKVVVPRQAGLGARYVTAPNARAATAIAAALSYLGTPYAWGGGGPNGPSKGIHDGGVADAHHDYNKVGFDCSGLTQYAYAQAGITIPDTSQTQRAAATGLHSFAEAKPGDLLFYGHGAGGTHHVALYLGTIGGHGYVVEALKSGTPVKVDPVRTGGDFQRNAVASPWAGV